MMMMMMMMMMIIIIRIRIITVTDLYSAYRSEGTEVLDAAQEDKAREWPKFLIPRLHKTPALGGLRWNISKVWCGKKTRMIRVWLPDRRR